MAQTYNTIEESVALRHLASAVGYKWHDMLAKDYEGLGHIHDVWNEMYTDMECIVCLEQFIDARSNQTSGLRYKTKGFEESGRSTEE